jgi:hypothetical protein
MDLLPKLLTEGLLVRIGEPIFSVRQLFAATSFFDFLGTLGSITRFGSLKPSPTHSATSAWNCESFAIVT